MSRAACPAMAPITIPKLSPRPATMGTTRARARKANRSRRVSTCEMMAHGLSPPQTTETTTRVRNTTGTGFTWRSRKRCTWRVIGALPAA